MIDLIYVFKKIALLIVWGTDYEWAREKTRKSVTRLLLQLGQERTRAWASEAAVVMKRGGKGALIKNYIK